MNNEAMNDEAMRRDEKRQFAMEVAPMPALVLPAAGAAAPTRAYQKPRMKTVDRATVVRLIGVVKGL
ncbi:MAG: hypothetical protein AAB342_01375 [Chloroflexota bacterium]